MNIARTAPMPQRCPSADAAPSNDSWVNDLPRSWAREASSRPSNVRVMDCS